MNEFFSGSAIKKTGAKTQGTGQDALTPSQSPVSRSKVKELIHPSQEFDKKLLEIGSGEQLKYSLGAPYQGSKNKKVRDIVDRLPKGLIGKASGGSSVAGVIFLGFIESFFVMS